MKIFELLNHGIHCTCGRIHRCDIKCVEIGEEILDKLPSLIDAKHILLLSDQNTFAVCGDRVRSLLGRRIENELCYMTGKELLVPDELAVAKATALLTSETDFVLGIGSGVINDICKYVSFERKICCGIIATAPSMDGFASSGAAMIFNGMKITYTTHAPDLILADTKLLATAPSHMIAAGYADIIGKYSALNDWKLSELINGEYLCPFVYDLVMEKTKETEKLAELLKQKDLKALAALTEGLILIGICLTLLSTTRPGSGSEHHLSHYFEITGLINNRSYFLHGTDVGYATLLTAAMRERICRQAAPAFHPVSEEYRIKAYKRIYKNVAAEVEKLQNQVGNYKKDMISIYKKSWHQVLKILSECPTEKEISAMLVSVGFDLSDFEKQYGRECIKDGCFWGKDLKDRYSVLWLYFDLYGGIEA